LGREGPARAAWAALTRSAKSAVVRFVQQVWFVRQPLRRAAASPRVPPRRQWGSEIRPGETAGIVPLQERRARPPGFRFGPSACSESASTPARVWRGAGRRVPRVVSPALVWQCILASWRTRKQREPSRWREELATHDDEQGHSQAGYGVAVIDGVHGQGFWAGGGQTCPLAPMRALTEPRGGSTRMASESAATTV
jgi:hypothetical protein